MTLGDRIARRSLGAFSRGGALTVVTPDGTAAVVGRGVPSATVTVVDRHVYRRVARAGALGLAEAFIEGEVEVDDLRAFLLWGAENHARWGAGSVAGVAGPLRSLWQRLAGDRRHERIVTIVDHYDLGNDFYRAWLDPTMTYSAARYPTPATGLEEAQRHKYRTIAEHAGLRPGMRVLEIGCGWGGFACFAAEEFGVEVVALTVAPRQAEYARARAAEAGLSGRVDVLLRDFREVEGRFDAVVSIEMIESVDETVWPDLFRASRRLLVEGGTMVLQAITIDDALFDGYRRRQDFIQRYIFPGGQVPAPGMIRRLASSAGLELTAVEWFGSDYARTLAAWLTRFRQAWPELNGEGPGSQGLDERFRRMWEFYLAYCEAGFRTGATDVGQWRFSLRPGA